MQHTAMTVVFDLNISVEAAPQFNLRDRPVSAGNLAQDSHARRNSARKARQVEGLRTIELQRLAIHAVGELQR
jgi:hypothetical protein